MEDIKYAPLHAFFSLIFFFPVLYLSAWTLGYLGAHLDPLSVLLAIMCTLPTLSFVLYRNSPWSDGQNRRTLDIYLVPLIFVNVVGYGSVIKNVIDISFDPLFRYNNEWNQTIVICTGTVIMVLKVFYDDTISMSTVLISLSLAFYKRLDAQSWHLIQTRYLPSLTGYSMILFAVVNAIHLIWLSTKGWNHESD